MLRQAIRGLVLLASFGGAVSAAAADAPPGASSCSGCHPASATVNTPVPRILGRERNSVLIAPSGERFWPVFGTHRFSRIAPIIQHQFVQRTPERVEARLVTERPLTGEEEEALRRHIQAQLPWRFEIVFAYLPEIPRSASGKFEPFISDVGPEAYARRPMGA